MVLAAYVSWREGTFKSGSVTMGFIEHGGMRGLHYFAYCERADCSLPSPAYPETLLGSFWVSSARHLRDSICACTMGRHGQSGSHNRLRISSPQSRGLVQRHESVWISSSRLYERGTRAGFSICRVADTGAESPADIWLVDRAFDCWADAAGLVFDRNDLGREDNYSNTRNGFIDMASRSVQNTSGGSRKSRNNRVRKISL